MSLLHDNVVLFQITNIKLTMNKTIIAVIAAFVLVLGIGYVVVSISAHNREASLRETINSKIKDNKE